MKTSGIMQVYKNSNGQWATRLANQRKYFEGLCTKPVKKGTVTEIMFNHVVNTFTSKQHLLSSIARMGLAR